MGMAMVVLAVTDVVSFDAPFADGVVIEETVWSDVVSTIYFPEDYLVDKPSIIIYGQYPPPVTT